MDKSKDGINLNNTRYYEEKLKEDNPKNKTQLNQDKNDEENQLFENKDSELLDASQPETYYEGIMNSRFSLSKFLISLILILSTICLEFHIFQVALIFNFNLLINKVELITFNCLLFVGFAASWITKYYFIQFYQRLSIIIFSALAVLIITFIVITRSSFILFLCYPTVSFCLGVIYLNAEEMYEDYFMPQNIKLKDNLFLSSLKYGSLLILLFIWFSSKNYFSLWFVSYIILGCLVLGVGIVTYFVESSPIGLYKELVNKNNENEIDKEIFPLIESIKGKDAEILNKEVLKEELWVFAENQNLNKIWNAFYQYQDKDSKKLSIALIILLSISFCNSYTHTGLILGLPMWIHENPPFGQERMDYYFKMLAIVFSISSAGGFLASLFIWLLGNNKKSLLGLFTFFFMFIFLFVMVFVSKVIPFLGACAFLFVNSMSLILKNYVNKSFDLNTSYKNSKLLQLSFYLNSAISSILFLIFYKISPIFGFCTLIAFAAVGAFLNLFLSD